MWREEPLDFLIEDARKKRIISQAVQEKKMTERMQIKMKFDLMGIMY